MTRITFVIVFQLVIFNQLFGQDILIEPQKEKYAFDEKITVIFKTDLDVDSFKMPQFEGFQVKGGPNMTTKMSIVNGVAEHTKSWTYSLRPLQSGKINIVSPTLFVNGKEIKGAKKTIVVLKSKK